VTTRVEVFDAWERAEVVASGLEWHGDDAVQEAWRIWLSAGRPHGAVLDVEADRQRGSFRVRLSNPEAPEARPETEEVRRAV